MSAQKVQKPLQTPKKAQNRHENVRFGSIISQIFDVAIQTPNRKILISTAC